MEFFFQSEMEPHGGNHMETGGVFGISYIFNMVIGSWLCRSGCDKFDQLVEGGFIEDFASAKQVCLFWVPAVMKSLFRMNYLVPQSGCEVSSYILILFPSLLFCESLSSYSKFVGLLWQVNEADYQLSECGYICSDDENDLAQLYQYIHRYITIHLGLTDVTKGGKVSKFFDSEFSNSWRCLDTRKDIHGGRQGSVAGLHLPRWWKEDIHRRSVRVVVAKRSCILGHASDPGKIAAGKPVEMEVIFAFNIIGYNL